MAAMARKASAGAAARQPKGRRGCWAKLKAQTRAVAASS